MFISPQEEEVDAWGHFPFKIVGFKEAFQKGFDDGFPVYAFNSPVRKVRDLGIRPNNEDRVPTSEEKELEEAENEERKDKVLAEL